MPLPSGSMQASMAHFVKIIVLLLGLALAASGAAFLASRYLASKLGTGSTNVPQENLEQYASEDGVSFKYPKTYGLSSRTEGEPGRQWDALVLLPRGYTPPQDGEGPPAITLGVFPNPQNLSLKEWVRGDSRSNFALSSDRKLSQVTVGGRAGLAYTHSGLYEHDAVAVAHTGKIFLFSAGWIEEGDPIRVDFQKLLSTVQWR